MAKRSALNRHNQICQNSKQQATEEHLLMCHLFFHHTHFLSLSLAITHTNTHKTIHKLSLAHTLLPLTISLTHTHTLSLSLSLSLFLSLSRQFNSSNFFVDWNCFSVPFERTIHFKCFNFHLEIFPTPTRKCVNFFRLKGILEIVDCSQLEKLDSSNIPLNGKIWVSFKINVRVVQYGGDER